jgi:hypothetical protein
VAACDDDEAEAEGLFVPGRSAVRVDGGGAAVTPASSCFLRAAISFRRAATTDACSVTQE